MDVVAQHSHARREPRGVAHNGPGRVAVLCTPVVVQRQQAVPLPAQRPHAEVLEE